MKKINLAITGCLGRMGQQLIRSSKTVKNFKVVSVTENRMVNKKISGLELVKYLHNYAATGSEYTKILEKIIDQNELTDFDGAILMNSNQASTLTL